MPQHHSHLLEEYILSCSELLKNMRDQAIPESLIAKASYLSKQIAAIEQLLTDKEQILETLIANTMILREIMSHFANYPHAVFVGSIVTKFIENTPLTEFTDYDLMLVSKEGDSLNLPSTFIPYPNLPNIWHSSVYVALLKCAVKIDVLTIEQPEPQNFSHFLFQNSANRDFTIGALFLTRDISHVIDPTNEGLRHYKQKELATIHLNSLLSLTTDPIRVIRAIKFMARDQFTANRSLHNALFSISPTSLQQHQQRIERQLRHHLYSLFFPYRNHFLQLLIHYKIIEKLYQIGGSIEEVDIQLRQRLYNLQPQPRPALRLSLTPHAFFTTPMTPRVSIGTPFALPYQQQKTSSHPCRAPNQQPPEAAVIPLPSYRGNSGTIR